MSATHLRRRDEPRTNSSGQPDEEAPSLALPTLRLPSPRARAALAGALSLAVAATAVVAWAPWADDSPLDAHAVRVIEDRNEALAAATAGMVTFNTVDHAQVRTTVDAWLEVSAGALHREVRRDRATIASRARRAATDSSAEVVRTAISSFDEEAGKATVLGVLTVRTDPPKGRTRTRTARLRVLVQRIDSTWKLTYLETMGAGA